MIDLLKRLGYLVLEIAVFAAILGVIYTSISGLLVLLGIVDPVISEASVIDPSRELIEDYLPFFVSSIAAILLTHQVIFKRPLSFSGFTREGLFSDFSNGYILSFLLLSIGFGLLYVLRQIDISVSGISLSLFGMYALFFLIQSAVEELMMRSFLLPAIAHRFNIWIGLIVSSGIFAFMHYLNPNVTFLSLSNIFLAGMMLGMIYIKTGNIWAATGLHAGWNFLQGTFFGFKVSGLTLDSYLFLEDIGHPYLSGGSFGFEGSVIATMLMLGTCVYLYMTSREKFHKAYYIEEDKQIATYEHA